MAKEIAIQMNIDTRSAEDGVKRVNEGLKQTDKELNNMSDKDIALTNKLKALDAEVESGTLSMRQMSKSIMEYQSVALAAGRESPVGKQALAQAADLQDKMVDLRNETTRLAHDGANMQAAMQLGGGIVAGYGAFQGVTAMMGVENEKLKETFIKLQAAQTALVSIEQIRTVLEKESFLMIKGKVLWTKAETLATGLLSRAKVADATATAGATLATKAFTAALIATGIGAIVVAIGLLIANFDAVTTAVKKAVDWFKNLGEGVKLVISIIFPFIGLIRLVNAALIEMGVIESDAAETSRKASEKKAEAARKAAKEYIEAIKAEEKALKEATDAKVKEIDFEIAKRNAAGKDVSDLEREKIKLLIESTQKEIDLANKRNESRIKEIQLIAKMDNYVGDLAKERLKEIEAEGLALETSLTGYTQQLEIFEIKQTKIRRDAAAKNKKFAEEEFIEEYERRAANNIAFEEQEIASTNKTNEELLKIYQDNQEKIKKQREQDLKDELNANLAKIDAVENYANAASDITGSLFEVTNNLGKKGEAAEEKRAKRQFGVEKLLGITEAAINTAKGIVKYTASGNLPMVGVMAATGAAQIAAIASKKFQPGGGGGGSASSATSSITSGSVSSSSGGVEGSGGTQTTNTEDLTNDGGGMQTVLVLDSLTKVQNKQNKIDALSSI